MQIQGIYRVIGVLVFAGGLIAGLVIGVLTADTQAGRAPVQSIREADASRQYIFINPLLAVEIPESATSGTLDRLKSSMTGIISAALKQGQAEEVSVYMRENTSNWFTINDDQKFSPASLLKVPTMIAFLKKAETYPSLLNKRLYYDGSFDLNNREYFSSKNVIQPGHSYTVSELLKFLIEGSDNNANRLLHDALDQKFLDEVYQDIGLALPKEEWEDTMTPKDYTYFFRILYNATYLTREYSERALELLTKADFPSGIRGAIPADVPVAQKFGERIVAHLAPGTDTIIEDYKELHDCGIIFAPKGRFMLCIMTKGKSFQDLAGTIRALAQAAYDWESKR